MISQIKHNQQLSSTYDINIKIEGISISSPKHGIHHTGSSSCSRRLRLASTSNFHVEISTLNDTVCSVTFSGRFDKSTTASSNSSANSFTLRSSCLTSNCSKLRAMKEDFVHRGLVASMVNTIMAHFHISCGWTVVVSPSAFRHAASKVSL